MLMIMFYAEDDTLSYCSLDFLSVSFLRTEEEFQLCGGCLPHCFFPLCSLIGALIFLFFI